MNTKKKKKRPYKQFLKIGKYQLHIDFQLLLKQYKAKVQRPAKFRSTVGRN